MKKQATAGGDKSDGRGEGTTWEEKRKIDCHMSGKEPSNQGL